MGTVRVRHRLDIYHHMMSTGHYHGRCSCGVASPTAHSGNLVYGWFTEHHPEAQPR